MRGFSSESYGEAFADVYDEWYGPESTALGSLDATVAFLADLATPAGRVLELGVGTGRIAIPLAARVAELIGIDSSKKMLERLESADPTRTVTGVLGDMIDDLPGQDYDVVVAAYNTIFNLDSSSRQQQCFDRVAAALAPNGSFVVEAFVPRHAEDIEPRSQVTVRSITVDRVVLSASVHEAATQHAEGQFIEITEVGGVRLRPWSIRWAAPNELDEMAARSDMRLAGRWAGYDRSHFDATSERHVSVYTLVGNGPEARIEAGR